MSKIRQIQNNSKIYYYVILDTNSKYISRFIYLSQNNSSQIDINPFLYHSNLISIDLNYKTGHKLLFSLNKRELYYKNNYEYFNIFRNMCNGCIKSFNYLGEDLNQYYKGANFLL